MKRTVEITPIKSLTTFRGKLTLEFDEDESDKSDSDIEEEALEALEEVITSPKNYFSAKVKT